MIEKAIAFAAEHHADQVDKAGEPYIWHPIAVALDMARKASNYDPGFITEAEIVAAVLHDVVEDCGVELSEIEAGFGPEVAAIVDAVTRRDGEEYEEFIQRVADSGKAPAVVKTFDLGDNMREERLAKLPPDEALRLRSKYTSALELLGDAYQRSEMRLER